MGFKTGDKVICINGNWYDAENNRYSFDPKKGQELTTDFLTTCGRYICFQEIPNLDKNGNREFYNTIGFRKVEPFKSNAISKELANKAKERKESNPLTPLRFKPTKEKVNA